MPNDKKNPQDQQRQGQGGKDQGQGMGEGVEREQQGDRGQPGFTEREDRIGQKQGAQKQDQTDGGMDRQRQGNQDRQYGIGQFERDQMNNDDDTKRGGPDTDVEDGGNEDRVVQRNPQQEAITSKPERH
ncbi:MAG: hypothetical protein WKG01_15895 [Kofleriaceae bacterium]